MHWTIDGILSRILAWQSSTAISAGDPITARVAGEEGRLIADAIGDGLNSRQCRVNIGWAHLIEGDVTGAVSQFGAVSAECEQAHDENIS